MQLAIFKLCLLEPLAILHRRDLTLFFWKLQKPSFYFTDQSPKIKIEIFQALEMGKIVFDLDNGKIKFLSFSLCPGIAFKKFKEDIPLRTGSKNLLNFFCFADFSQHFLRPCCAKLKSNITKWNFGIGVL